MDPNFHVISATFNHKFTNFSQIHKLTQSPACWIQNIPWKIFIEQVVRDNKKYLSIFVSCAASVGSTPWSCRASVRTYKLDGTRPKIVRTTKYLVFDSAASTSWGHDTFILWDTVLNPSNGFIKNDTITIEVSIDAEMPVGIKLTANYFTDERANAAVKLCDQTISSLQSQIQDVTTQNAELQGMIATSSNLISNLENRSDISKKRADDLEQKYNKEHETNTGLKKSIDEAYSQLKIERDKNDDLSKTLNEKNTKIAEITEQLRDFESTKLKLSNSNKEKDEIQMKYTSLLSEFENNKTVATITDSNTENKIKTEIDTIRNENIDLKKQNLSLQNELDVATNKLKPLDDLKRKIEELNEERKDTQLKVDSIMKELSDSKSVIEMMKKATIEEKQRIGHEKEELQAHIKSSKSQLYEALVKLKISQDMNDELEKLKSDNNKLVNQMKIGYKKYNDLKDEKVTLISQIDSLKKEISNANDNISSSKIHLTLKQKELKTCEDEATKSKTDNIGLNTTNKDLSSKLAEANSKISSFENSNSEDLTKLVNEKNDLNNTNNTLQSKLKSVEAELQKMKDKDDEISRLNAEKTNLATQLSQVNKELDDTKTKLSKSHREVEKIMIMERDLSKLQAELDNTKNKLERMEEKKLDEVISKLYADKTNVEGLLSSVKEELEKTKTKLKEAQNQTTGMVGLKDEDLNHKKQIATLQKLLDGTNIKIKDKNEQSLAGEQTNLNEDPDFEVDLVKGIEDKTKKMKGKTTRSSQQDNVRNSGKIQVESSLERRLESMRTQFEIEVKEADQALQEERTSMSKRIGDLFHQLKVEKLKQEDAVDAQTELKGEICILKDEARILKKVKNDTTTHLKTCQDLCVDIFGLIIRVLNELKNNGKLSCTIETVIVSKFSRLEQFWNLENEESSIPLESKLDTLISTDVLQEKLKQIQTNYEVSSGIIRKNSELEQRENAKLKTANEELVIVLENEENLTKHYKELFKFTHSRLVEVRKQLAELENEFFEEKWRRIECEEMDRKSKILQQQTELLMKDLKEKLLKQTFELTDDDTKNKNQCLSRKSISSFPTSCTDDSIGMKNDPITNQETDLADFSNPQTISVSATKTGTAEMQNVKSILMKSDPNKNNVQADNSKTNESDIDAKS